uniref:Serpentine Receptor, class T n=1 Tax=Rhabditophanes sp. KR3021 TaxID=114890 RepID=A0AC35U2W5_9BILA
MTHVFMDNVQIYAMIKNYSLFYFLTTKSILNCTMFPKEQVDQIMLDNKNIKFGVTYIVVALFCLCVHIPCLIALFEKHHRKHLCFKILISIAVFDLISIVNVGLISGVFACMGMVACSAPTFMLISGAVTYTFFVSHTTATIFLVLTRVIEIWNHLYIERLFGDIKIYLWVFPLSMYVFYIVMFTQPMTFSSVILTWTFDPLVGMDLPGHKIVGSIAHTFNNAFYIISTITMYVVLIGIYLKKTSSSSIHNQNQTVRLTVQIFIIGIVDSITCTIFILIDFIPMETNFYVYANLMWLFQHVVQSLILTIFNKNIRRTIKSNILGPEKTNIKTIIQPKRDSFIFKTKISPK